MSGVGFFLSLGSVGLSSVFLVFMFPFQKPIMSSNFLCPVVFLSGFGFGFLVLVFVLSSLIFLGLGSSGVWHGGEGFTGLGLGGICVTGGLGGGGAGRGSQNFYRGKFKTSFGNLIRSNLSAFLPILLSVSFSSSIIL